MLSALLRLGALILFLAALVGALAAPGYGALHLLSIALAAGALHVLLGGWSAGFVAVGMLAAPGIDTDGGFVGLILCPGLVLLSAGGVLASCVVRFPKLAERVENGWLGPGGA